MNMYNVLMATTLALLLSACFNAESYRGPIEDVTAKWEETSASLQGLIGKVSGEQAKAAELFLQMEIPQDRPLAPEDMDELNGMRLVMSEKIGDLTQLNRRINDYVVELKETSTKVEGLKTGLEEGNLAREDVEQIENYQQQIAETRSKVDDWNTELSGITTEYNKIYEDYMQRLGQPAAAVEQ